MKRIKEADISSIIKGMQGNFGGDNESQMKGLQLLKGLATSDDPKANEFMKALNTATTQISKDVLGDKKEAAMKPGDEAKAIIQNWTKAGGQKSDLSNPAKYKKAIADYEKAMGHKVGDKTDAVLSKQVNEAVLVVEEDTTIGDIVLEAGDELRVIEE